MLRGVGLILGGTGKCCLGGSRPYLQLCTSHIYWQRSTGVCIFFLHSYVDVSFFLVTANTFLFTL